MITTCAWFALVGPSLDEPYERAQELVFFVTPSVAPCPHGSSKGFVYLMSTAVHAMCHNFTDVQSRRFIFSRGKPCVISWLVVPFRIPKSDVYK